jgi:type IV secretory pathway TrbD component
MLKKTPIYQSLYNPVLFVGCERLPFTIVATIGGVILMNYHTLLAAAITIIFYVISIGLIRRVNMDDPQFFLGLYRYIWYFEDYYPANEFYPGKDYLGKNTQLLQKWMQ